MTYRSLMYQHDPIVNKGTGFTRDERLRHGIDGLLPTRVESLQEQSARVMANLHAKTSGLDKYSYLAALQNENETLFYRVVLDHLEEMLPIVYTPTVGQACLEWSRIYMQPRGIYICEQHRGRIAQVLRNWRREVAIIVVTDGGRILGLGDLGANGMGIPVGKLALYTACAGVRPELCLPVMLDVGTDNEKIRSDPLYLGDRRPRITGERWDSLLDEFIAATQSAFPGAVVQFEDFNTACAFRLLQRYRERICCFNDDMQGTGAMGLAGLYAAGRITGRKLSEQRILFVGAGEACLGIGNIVVPAMVREGLSNGEARQRCLFADSKGLIVSSRGDLPDHKRAFAQDRAPTTDLCAAIESFRPTVLIGASGRGALFTPAVLSAMAAVSERPVVFALSNPTANAECTAEQAYVATDGRAVFASGSPFPPVTVAGRVHSPGQGNNSCVFPGIGLGLLLSGSKRATDQMFFAAAQALAGQVSQRDVDEGRIFPAASHLREVATAVAIAVANVAYEQGHATRTKPADLAAEAVRVMYEPRYASGQVQRHSIAKRRSKAVTSSTP